MFTEHSVCGAKDLAEFNRGHWQEAVGWDCYGMWATNQCSQHLRKGRPLPEHPIAGQNPSVRVGTTRSPLPHKMKWYQLI